MKRIILISALTAAVLAPLALFALEEGAPPEPAQGAQAALPLEEIAARLAQTNRIIAANFETLETRYETLASTAAPRATAEDIVNFSSDCVKLAQTRLPAYLKKLSSLEERLNAAAVPEEQADELARVLNSISRAKTVFSKRAALLIKKAGALAQEQTDAAAKETSAKTPSAAAYTENKTLQKLSAAGAPVSEQLALQSSVYDGAGAKSALNAAGTAAYAPAGEKRNAPAAWAVSPAVSPYRARPRGALVPAKPAAVPQVASAKTAEPAVWNAFKQGIEAARSTVSPGKSAEELRELRTAEAAASAIKWLESLPQTKERNARINALRETASADKKTRPALQASWLADTLAFAGKTPQAAEEARLKTALDARVNALGGDYAALKSDADKKAFIDRAASSPRFPEEAALSGFYAGNPLYAAMLDKTGSALMLNHANATRLPEGAVLSPAELGLAPTAKPALLTVASYPPGSPVRGLQYTDAQGNTRFTDFTGTLQVVTTAQGKVLSQKSREPGGRLSVTVADPQTGELTDVTAKSPYVWQMSRRSGKPAHYVDINAIKAIPPAERKAAADAAAQDILGPKASPYDIRQPELSRFIRAVSGRGGAVSLCAFPDTAKLKIPGSRMGEIEKETTVLQADITYPGGNTERLIARFEPLKDFEKDMPAGKTRLSGPQDGLVVYKRTEGAKDPIGGYMKMLRYVGGDARDVFLAETEVTGNGWLKPIKTVASNYAARYKTENGRETYSKRIFAGEKEVLFEEQSAAATLNRTAVQLTAAGLSGALGMASAAGGNKELSDELFARANANLLGNDWSRRVGGAYLGDTYESGYKQLGIDENRNIQNVGQEMGGMGYRATGAALQGAVNYANTLPAEILIISGAGALGAGLNTAVLGEKAEALGKSGASAARAWKTMTQAQKGYYYAVKGVNTAAQTIYYPMRAASAIDIAGSGVQLAAAARNREADPEKYYAAIENFAENAMDAPVWAYEMNDFKKLFSRKRASLSETGEAEERFAKEARETAKSYFARAGEDTAFYLTGSTSYEELTGEAESETVALENPQAAE